MHSENVTLGFFSRFKSEFCSVGGVLVCSLPKIIESFERSSRFRINAIRFIFFEADELSKSESLRDVSETRIGDTFPAVFRRLYGAT